MRVARQGHPQDHQPPGRHLETLAYVSVDLVKTRGDFYVARHVAHRERLTTLRSSYARINAGYAVVEVIDAIPSDDVADEEIFDLLTRVLLDARRRALRPDAGAGVVLLQAPRPRRLRAGRRRLRQLRPRPARSSPSTPQVGGALCADCRSGTSLSTDALALIRRIVGGDLAPRAARGDRRAGAGEVDGASRSSRSRRTSASGCARRARRRRSPPSRPGSVP